MISLDDEDAETLIKLGLNSSQAKIYLALVSLGVADAKKIAHTVGIDRGEVYRQLENLQKEALVEKILDFPNEYKPMALSEAIETLIQRKKRENDEILQKANAMLAKRIHSKTPEEERKISIIPKDEYFVRHITKCLKTIHKELLWYTPISRIPAGEEVFYQVQKEAFDRGVRYRIIAELDEPTRETIRYVQNFRKANPSWKIRFLYPHLSVTFIIWDGGKGMNFLTEKPTGMAGSRILTTNNDRLIRVFKDYFELKWKNAMKECPTKEIDI